MPKSLDGSIYRTPDGRRWFVRVQFKDAAGRSRQKKRICLTLSNAKETLKALRLEIERESSERKTYRELDRFFREKYVHPARFVGGQKLSGFRQDTRTVERYLDRALEFFADKEIDSITYADLVRYKERIVSGRTVRGGQRSMSEINHHLRRLRRLFTVAVEQGWLPVNPFKRGGPLIVESFEAERTRTLSTVEETRLLAACDKWRKHLKPVIVFAIETGLRRGEIQTLRWSSVNIEGRTVKIESLNSKTLKSRLVPLSLRAVETLTQLRQNSRKRQSDLVFGVSDFKKAFNHACSNAGLSDVHFHDLRHTAITRWLESGISPALAMKASGHSQMKTFLRYVNQSESSVYEFALRLDKAA